MGATERSRRRKAQATRARDEAQAALRLQQRGPWRTPGEVPT